MTSLMKVLGRYETVTHGGHHWTEMRAALIALQSKVAQMRARNIPADKLRQKITQRGKLSKIDLERIFTPMFSLEEDLADDDGPAEGSD